MAGIVLSIMKNTITLDEFGKSAAKDDVLASFAFNFEAVVSRVEKY